MKKLLLTIVLSLLSVSLNARVQSNHDLPAVSMVSYEQSWLDNKGTIALKNNTSEEIHNVSFVLEYLDMQGKPMDYETFTRKIDIAPGMTKKLDIPAYEHSRNYHYYKSEAGYNHKPFKIKYELKGYSSSSGNPQNDSDNNTPNYVLPFIITLFLILGIYVGLYVLVAVMAQRRDRNPVVWLLLSYIATPLLICIILLVLGRKNKTVF